MVFRRDAHIGNWILHD